MEFFVPEVQFNQIRASVSGPDDVASLPARVALAWHSRQRDPALALGTVTQIRAHLVHYVSKQDESILARCQLVEAEIKWLRAESASAAMLANSALDAFEGENDAPGCADAHWLLSRIAVDRGDYQDEARHLQWMIDFARRAQDSDRQWYAKVALAYSSALRAVDVSLAQWQTVFEAALPDVHPGVRAMICAWFGACAALQSDFGRSVTFLMQAWELAWDTGQVRDAIRNAANLGDGFSNLNDHQSALDWMQRGLETARAMRWPVSIAISLGQTADVLRHLGRLDAAQELLDEALQALHPLGVSRSYAITLEYLGDLALDHRDYATALKYFAQLQQHADKLQQFDFQTSAWRGQAHALSQLGQVDEALIAAHDALALAEKQHDAFAQISILQVLADIHARHQLPLPEAKGIFPPLHYLLKALHAATRIEGYTVAGDILDAIADAYATIGDFAEAFVWTQKANLARESTHSLVATNRAIAMQVKHQTERAKAASEYHRQLAMAEASRAEVLAKTNATLARLGTVGQEITAQLNSDAVLAALNRHVHGLLDVSSFAVYLVDPDGRHLVLAFGVEQGLALPPDRISRKDPHSSSARCWREGREISLNLEPPGTVPEAAGVAPASNALQGPALPFSASEPDPALIPGTRLSLSRLFAPLMIGERMLGVMTVQSFQRHAYGVSERFIFRTLCAYGAIALENSNAYQQLEVAQAQLVEQAKLAALGSLVAGVAHELNTPIGNSLMMSSALYEKADAIDGRMQQRGLQHRDLVEFLDDAQQAASVIIRGLTHGADLVSSFKQVAVDRTAAHRRVYNLQQTCHEVVATMMNQIRLAGHQIELEIPGAIMFDSYPGPFGQVIANFISNALAHAFPAGQTGRMRLSAQPAQAGRVLITFSDDGVGISEANVKRIFDPFFTGSQGNNGLGLSISYNIVTSLLNGQIRVASTLGSGTRFMLDLPVTVASAHS